MKKIISILLVFASTLSMAQTKVNLSTGTQYSGSVGTNVITTNGTAITKTASLDTANTNAVGRVTVKAPMVVNVGGKTYQISADTSTSNTGLTTLYKNDLKLNISDTNSTIATRNYVTTHAGSAPRCYLATITANIGSAPTVDFEYFNNTTYTFTFGRTSAGIYTINLSGTNANNYPRFLVIGPGNNQANSYIVMTNVISGTITFKVYVSGNLSDLGLVSVPIQIYFYPL